MPQEPEGLKQFVASLLRKAAEDIESGKAEENIRKALGKQKKRGGRSRKKSES